MVPFNSRPITVEDLPQPASTTPVPPGKSGFNIKGEAYRAFAAFVESAFPGGMSAYAGRLPSEELRDFVQQPFLAASWYDIFPMVPLTKVVCEELEVRFFDWVRQASERRASEALNGTLRRLFTETQPGAILERAGNIMRQFHDFGEFRLEHLTSGRARVIRSGIPENLIPWFYPMIIGFSVGIAPSLRDKGRQERIVMLAPQPGGKIRGLPVATIAIEFPFQER